MFTEFKLPCGTMQKMWPSHCVQGSWGSDFHPLLHVAPSDIIVHKGINTAVDSYSAFYDNGHANHTEMAAL